jgi:hypothetical protein
MHIHISTVVATYMRKQQNVRAAGTYFEQHHYLPKGHKFIPIKYNTLKSKEVISTNQNMAIKDLHQYINKKIKIEHGL